MKVSTFLQVTAGTLLLSVSASALADNAVTSRPANVLAGPDDSYPVVAQLDADTPVQVMGCLNDWSYCDVAFQGARGWLYAPDLTYAYQGGYVPLYSYGPALGITVESFSVDNYWGRYYHDRPWYSRREEFDRRGPPHHERPPGPAPSHSPPPREVVQHRQDNHSGGVRLSSAGSDSRHQENERRAGSAENRAPAPRPEERTAPRPEERAPAARPETRAKPAEHPTPQREERRTASPNDSKHEEQPPKEERKDRPDHPDRPQ